MSNPNVSLWINSGQALKTFVRHRAVQSSENVVDLNSLGQVRKGGIYAHAGKEKRTPTEQKSYGSIRVGRSRSWDQSRVRNK